MKRENKYLVLKRDDIIKYLTNSQQLELSEFCLDIMEGRESEGKGDKAFVVVSEEWPMYEDVWKSIEEWVDSNVD